MKEKIEQGIVLAAAISSILIALAHYLGRLESHWVRDSSPVVTLVLLGVIAGYLSIDFPARLDRLQTSLDHLDAAHGLQIAAFKTPHEMYAYWTKRLHEAHRSV